MAKAPKTPRRDSKLPPSNWTRTAGYFGDKDMEEQAEFNENGAGVELKIKAVGADPNEDVGPARRPGSEL